MKIVWTIVALLLLGGLIVLMQPTHESASTLSQDAMIDDALGGDSLVQDTTSPANTQDSAAKPSTNADHATATTATIDVAAFKERFGVSRKYAIPLLEFLDRERVTRRAGETRQIL